MQLVIRIDFNSSPMKIGLACFVISCISLVSNAQGNFLGFSSPPKNNVDTLYFPFEDSIQLIAVTHYDTWQRQVDFKEMTEPRGLSWSMVMGPAPKNHYFFRNTKGEIVSQFNVDGHANQRFRSLQFSNVDKFGIVALMELRELNEHVLYYGENDKVGLVNMKGKVVLPAEYDAIRRYQQIDGQGKILVVTKNGLFGLVSEDMKVLFPPIYKGYYPEHEQQFKNCIKVCDTLNKIGLITEQGEIKIPLIYDQLLAIHDSMYVAYVFGSEKIFVGSGSYRNNIIEATIFDKNYKVLTYFQGCDDIQYSAIGQFIIKRNKKYGVIDNKGKEVIPIIYDNLSKEHGSFYVHVGDKSGLLSLEGKELIPIEYERNMYWYDKAIYVQQNGLIGVFNSRSFQLVAEPQFKYKHWNMGKYELYRADGSKGYVQHSPKEDSFYMSPEGIRTDL